MTYIQNLINTKVFTSLILAHNKQKKNLENWSGFAFLDFQNALLVGSLFLVFTKICFSFLSYQIVPFWNFSLLYFYFLFALKTEIIDNIKDFICMCLRPIFGEKYYVDESYDEIDILPSSKQRFAIACFEKIILFRLFVFIHKYNFFLLNFFISYSLLMNKFLLFSYFYSLFMLISRLLILLSDDSMLDMRNSIRKHISTDELNENNHFYAGLQ